MGFVATGVVHLLIGLLALRVAAGNEQESADTTGALQTLTGMPGGTALIWACLVGCAALALWNLGQAVWPAGDGDRADRWKARGKAAGQAVATPTMLPVPTVAASAVAIAWQEEISPLSPVALRRRPNATLMAVVTSRSWVMGLRPGCVGGGAGGADGETTRAGRLGA